MTRAEAQVHVPVRLLTGPSTTGVVTEESDSDGYCAVKWPIYTRPVRELVDHLTAKGAA